MDSYGEFFASCAARGLRTDREIACAFRRTQQTITNWRALVAHGARPPRHLGLEVAGYDLVQAGAAEPRPGIAAFKAWQNKLGLGTLEAVGGVFGCTRQAVHNWFSRERLPRWLPLACMGHEACASAASAASAAGRVPAHAKSDSPQTGDLS